MDYLNIDYLNIDYLNIDYLNIDYLSIDYMFGVPAQNCSEGRICGQIKNDVVQDVFSPGDASSI